MTRPSPIGRRSFLAALATPLVVRPTFRRQRDAAASDPVVIVGAGLAGLRAAAVLRKAGRSVVVLEASGGAGGRVRTIRAPFAEGLYAEAGPIRIAGMQQTVLQLVKEHGLSLVPFGITSGAALMSVRGVTTRLPGGLKEATAKLALKPDEAGLGQGALLQKYVRDLPSDMGDPKPTADSYARWQSYDRVTWPEWLKSRGASADAVTLMTLGGESKDLSALYVLRQFALLQSTDQFFKIEGGMDRLPRAMAASLGSVVRYNAPVVRIDQTAGSPRVDYLQSGRTASIRASRVVLAIPFSTLRQIEIRPAFSAAKTRAIADLPYFPATRILLQTRTRFWEDKGLSGSARTDQPAEIWDCTYDLPATRGILGATVGGAIGMTMAGMSWDQSVKLGSDLVAKTFPELRANFDKGSVYRWALDPWARGAFAVFHPGQMSAMMPDIARPEGHVHFAGEHTSSWMGWMEGALESGERAGREILGEPDPRTGRRP
jgi:monoamine oxidase